MNDQLEIPSLPVRQDATPKAPTTTPPAACSRRRLTGWLIACLLLMIVSAVAWRIYSDRRPHLTGRKSRSELSEAQPVEVATVIKGYIDVVLDAIGTVTPLATVTVKTQINGQLQTVGFTEGQIVRKGDFLAQIDPRPYQALLEQARGQLARDEALLRQGQTDLARFQALLKRDSIARQQAEDQGFLVQQNQASVRADQGQVDTQNLNLAYCHIISPVDGRVGFRQVDPGNYVQTSDANGLVVITQLQPISVVFPLPEDNLLAVLRRFQSDVTLPVTLYDRANTTELARGKLSTTDNQVDTTTGTWKLRALFPNSDNRLFPNQFVNARLVVDTLHDVLTVSNAAVQRGAPGTYVYLLKADSTVTVRPIKTGVVNEGRVEIVSGLAAGDGVVVSGADRLREGARVTVQTGLPGSGSNAGVTPPTQDAVSGQPGQRIKP
jgi:multidrug efflux system membrane fusion protein